MRNKNDWTSLQLEKEDKKKIVEIADKKGMLVYRLVKDMINKYLENEGKET